ncbi:hypothetical protein K488DRAFT_82100 [Vararia minispora EC-137]|uniref:Uncharacterized protein n=1 Tax=Vararia minispora EC-137 TaxID=1314806 RepID=A0ACB8QYZ3_9AGAM|nr:hypothetical protein K488DRAFT_82100 [Vararia minispora EC-137]
MPTPFSVLTSSLMNDEQHENPDRNKANFCMVAVGAGQTSIGFIVDKRSSWASGTATLPRIHHGFSCSGVSKDTRKPVAKGDPALATTLMDFMMLTRGLGSLPSTPIATTLLTRAYVPAGGKGAKIGFRYDDRAWSSEARNRGKEPASQHNPALLNIMVSFDKRFAILCAVSLAAPALTTPVPHPHGIVRREDGNWLKSSSPKILLFHGLYAREPESDHGPLKREPASGDSEAVNVHYGGIGVSVAGAQSDAGPGGPSADSGAVSITGLPVVGSINLAASDVDDF